MNKIVEVILKGATSGITMALAKYIKENKQQILDKIYEISMENINNSKKIAKVTELLEKEGLFQYIINFHKEMFAKDENKTV